MPLGRLLKYYFSLADNLHNIRCKKWAIGIQLIGRYPGVFDPGAQVRLVDNPVSRVKDWRLLAVKTSSFSRQKA